MEHHASHVDTCFNELLAHLFYIRCHYEQHLPLGDGMRHLQIGCRNLFQIRLPVCSFMGPCELYAPLWFPFRREKKVEIHLSFLVYEVKSTKKMGNHQLFCVFLCQEGRRMSKKCIFAS